MDMQHFFFISTAFTCVLEVSVFFGQKQKQNFKINTPYYALHLLFNYLQ